MGSGGFSERLSEAVGAMAPALAVQKKPRGRADAQCIAHLRSGRRCPRAVGGRAVPYCEGHLQKGDGAVKVHEHPGGYGKILVARFHLPKGYRHSALRARAFQ